MQNQQNQFNSSQDKKLLDKTKWEELITEWEKSNESQRAFCNRLGININTFSYIRSKMLRKNEKSKPSKFIPITVTESNKKVETHDVILESSNGIKLIIASSISPAKFKQLLELVGWKHA
jgi:hypothetical protein